MGGGRPRALGSRQRPPLPATTLQPCLQTSAGLPSLCNPHCLLAGPPPETLHRSHSGQFQDTEGGGLVADPGWGWLTGVSMGSPVQASATTDQPVRGNVAAAPYTSQSPWGVVHSPWDSEAALTPFHRPQAQGYPTHASLPKRGNTPATWQLLPQRQTQAWRPGKVWAGPLQRTNASPCGGALPGPASWDLAAGLELADSSVEDTSPCSPAGHQLPTRKQASSQRPRPAQPALFHGRSSQVMHPHPARYPEGWSHPIWSG